ncbi:MAG: AAA family ATPase [Solirubrobacterales bacterium]|nr:AAA family ATPase [Solirubrobacterales bacterium]
MTVARLADAVPVGVDLASLLDRERELATLERCLADAGAERGRLVVIEGPAGIGKTALLAAARDLARERGVCSLSARGTPLEQNFSYGAVRQLFEPFALAAREPDSSGVVAGSAALAMPAFVENPSPHLSTQDSSFATMHGLYWLTANLASREPLLLLVDDCHWVDAGSLRFLTHLGARLEGLRVLVLAAVRRGDRSTAPQLLGSLLSLAHEVLDPSPLGSVAAARVVRRELGSASEEFCRACHVATGGNPLLLRELVTSWVRDGAKPDVEDAHKVAEFGAGSVARLLARRLAVLPAGSDSLAVALAVLGDGSQLRHVAALAELEFEEAAESADGLRAASVLAPSVELAFAHPVLRAAAEELIGSEQRALAHGRAAELLAKEGAPPDRLALHLLYAHPRGDERVVATLRAASQIATGRGAPEAAATYLRRALEEPPASTSRGPLLLELGLAEMSARCDARAVDDVREAVAMIDVPATRATAALRAGRALGAGAFFKQAALILESVSDPDLRIEAELAASSFHLASRVSAGLRRLERYDDEDLPLGPGWHFMQVMLAHRSLIRGDPVSATSALLDRALAGPELFEEQSVVSVFAAIDLVLIDRLGDAEQLCTAFIEEGQRRGASSIVSSFAFPRALASLRRGRLRDAEADARWSFEGLLALVPRSESGSLFALAFLLDALTELGDFRGADEALARVDSPDRELPELIGCAFVVEARGRLRVAQGRLREGLAELREAGERWQRLRSPWPSTWREDAALALAKLGEHDEARSLAAEQLKLARASGLPRALGTATRAAGLVAPRPQRIPLLREAVDLLGQTSARLELAKARLELGAALRRDGHRVEARDHLRQGLELAHRAAAAPLAARAREELLAAGGRPRKPVFTGIDALTASELRVARLAAKGQTNREIAESLFVTQRTVETHLRHAFQKLDIARRDDLPAELTAPIPGELSVS